MLVSAGYSCCRGLRNLRSVVLTQLLAAPLICGASVTFAAPAELERTHHFEIPAQSLETALLAFSRQAGVSIFVNSEAVDAMRAPALVGTLPASAALDHLLKPSGLRYSADGEIVTIAPPSAESSGATRTALRLAQAETTPPSAAAKPPSGEGSLQEVVVTAQKREERLRDVPVPVTALPASALAESNKSSLDDFYSSIPGLNVQPRIQSGNNLVIRGITTGGFSNPTVGITVDDVPYGASTELAGGLLLPDLDPADLSRIEVLRGPQGTLYGALSMGGLVKYVTVDPSTSGWSGQLQGGLNGVKNGDGLGYNVRGSINAPVSEDFAVRASAFTRLEPGYIDNPALDARGVNKARVSGGRVSGLWQPSDAISLKLSALYQESKGDGASEVFFLPGFGDLQQNYVAGAGAYVRKVQGYSANLNVNLGASTLTSITGYNVNQFADSFDLTYLFMSSPVTTEPYDIPGRAVVEDNKTNKFSQEVRLLTPLAERWDLLVGGFYTHEKSVLNQYAPATDPISGAVLAERGFNHLPITFQEYAAFANLTWKITDRFDVQVGGRQSHVQEDLKQTQNATLFDATSPIVSISGTSSANAFTYLFTPRFKITPDIMVYARLASGYRAGGPNPSSGGAVPAEYDPDKTQNYEIGLKGDFLEHRVTIDASVYYIDWKNIQISLINPENQQGYFANGSRAKSQGIELSVELRPTDSLRIAAWVVRNDAVLKEPFPPLSDVYGAKGDRLPNTSRISGNFSLQQEFPLGANLHGFVGALASYIGEREGLFQPTPVRQEFPGYAKFDVNAGVRNGSWTGNFFVNNLADRRGIVAGGLGALPSFGFTIIQPRSFGVTVTKAF